MSDVNIKVGAQDDGFNRLISQLSASLKKFAADARGITREQIQDARDAVAATLDNQRKTAQAYRDTVRAGKEAVAAERDVARERVTQGRDALRQAQEQARLTAQNAQAQIRAAREQGAALKEQVRNELNAAKARRDAQVGAARELAGSAREGMQAARAAAREQIAAARDAGNQLKAQARENLNARRNEVREQRAAGRELVQATREQARAEVEAARQSVQAAVQRTRELRKQFADQIADAKRAVIERRKALEDATAGGDAGTVANARGALSTARSRLDEVRQTRDSVLGGSKADAEQARQSAQAVKEAAREKIAAAQAVVRAANEEGQAQIRAAQQALEAAKASSAQKVQASQRAAQQSIAAAQTELDAARRTIDEEVRSGKIAVDEARKKLALADQTAKAKIEGARRFAAVENNAAQAEVNAAKNALAQTVSLTNQRVAAAQRAANAANNEKRGLLDSAKLATQEAREKLRVLLATKQLADGRLSHVRAMASESVAVNQLIGYFRRLAAETGALYAIHRFVAEGTEFNQTIETATLGIGALITAEAKLTDANGNELKGREALNTAMKISEGQMTRLRIAGLQTAATTEELVKAMQQAVGPGLAAGGSIDQIRTFTIQLTQAASSIGLPFYQLNEEVRSLLAGTINYNTRIAKSLGITNQMVRSWRDTGTLFEHLNERFAAFNLAGERSLTTWQTLRSNIVEAFQVFAGASTKPFFDAMRVEGGKALNSLFDFDRGQIARRFEGVVDLVKTIFQSAGNIITTLINDAVDGAAALSEWFNKNREAVQGVVIALENALRAFGRILLSIGKVVAGFVQASTESGRLQRFIESIEHILGFVADHMQLIINAFLIIKGLNFAVQLAQMNLLLGGFTAFVAIFTTLDTLIPRVEDKMKKLILTMDNAANKTRKEDAETAKLALQFQRLERDAEKEMAAIEKDPKLGHQALNDIRARQAAIVREMIALNPDQADALLREKEGTKGLTDAIRQLGIERQHHIGQENVELQQRKSSIEAIIQQKQAELDAAEATREALRKDVSPGGAAAQVGAQGRVDRIKGELQAQTEELKRVQKALVDNALKIRDITEEGTAQSTDVTPQRVDTPKVGRGALNDLRQAAQAAIQEVKNVLDEYKAQQDRLLAESEISYRQYYDNLIDMERTAAAAQIQIREAQYSKTTDVGERRLIKADIDRLQRLVGTTEKAGEIENKYRAEQYKKEVELQRQVAAVRAQAAVQEGNTASARSEAVSLQFEQLRKTLEAQANAEGRAGVEAIDRLIQVEYARARLNDLETLMRNAQESFQATADQLDVAHSQGQITFDTQAAQLNKAYADRIKLIEDVIGEMREMARLSGDEDGKAARRITVLTTELAQLKIQQAEVASNAIAVGHAARRGFEQAINGMFESLFHEGGTIKKTLAQIGIDILREMNAVLAPQLAQTMTAVFNRAFADLGQSAAGSFVHSLGQWIKTGLTAVFDAILKPFFKVVGEGLSFALGPVFGPRKAAETVASAAGDAAAGGGKTVLDNMDELFGLGADTAAKGAETAAATIQQAAATTFATAVGAMAAAVGAFVTAVGTFVVSAGAKAATGIAGSAFGAVGSDLTLTQADGGLVPGFSPHARADNIVARLTAREFVQPVPAVEYYGTRFMESLRRRAIPREAAQALIGGIRMPMLSAPSRVPRYAEGGTVAASLLPVRSGADSLSAGKLHVLIQSNDSHIVRVIKSPAGVSAQLDNMHQNPHATRRVLRR